MIILPGSDTKIPIEHWSYLDETGQYRDDHPAMLYQTALIRFLESTKHQERISKAKALLLFNRWHYKPVENYHKIQEYIIDHSQHGFPWAFYFGLPTTKIDTGDILNWKQLVFKRDEDFHNYLGIIELIILSQIDKLNGQTKSAANKTPRTPEKYSLDGLFGDMANEFKRDFTDIVTARKKTPIKTFQEVVHYLYSMNSNFPSNVSALAELFAMEFGKILGSNVESLRKGLSLKKKQDIGHPDAISRVFKKYSQKSQ